MAAHLPISLSCSSESCLQVHTPTFRPQPPVGKPRPPAPPPGPAPRPRLPLLTRGPVDGAV
ncbi:hypothetical protein EYF80_028390 [Liparis tanakae]|uniref:Uncharacterized protein n=1 Tax=Liparis tanakae TaxID=230148 RepID=A0A4Z2H8M4_9TELE|nr:hypothetical protein EYF80_028390 [Liparis tanakae]